MQTKIIGSDSVRVISSNPCVQVANPYTYDTLSNPILMKVVWYTGLNAKSNSTAYYVPVGMYPAGTEFELDCGVEITQLLVVGGTYDGYTGFYYSQVF